MVNFRKPIPEIVEILHKHGITLAMIDTVFNLVKEDIEAHTVPYSPNALNRSCHIR